ncbi:MAG: hypothetical protein MK106_11535 [Mariniblastus sp.]|nr:hypothetical protein [Mariniblastus sp.]
MNPDKFVSEQPLSATEAGLERSLRGVRDEITPELDRWQYIDSFQLRQEVDPKAGVSALRGSLHWMIRKTLPVKNGTPFQLDRLPIKTAEE